MARAGERGRVVMEDSFGELRRPTTGGVTVDRMPVMVNAAGPVGVRAAGPGALRAAGSGVRVVLATDPGTLAQAE